MHIFILITYLDNLSALSDDFLLYFELDAKEFAIFRSIVDGEGILCRERGDGGRGDAYSFEGDTAPISLAAALTFLKGGVKEEFIFAGFLVFWIQSAQACIILAHSSGTSGAGSSGFACSAA